MSALSHALTECGFSNEGLIAEDVIGPPLEGTLRTRGLVDDEIDRVRELYRVYFVNNGLREVRPFVGVPQLLERLHDFGAHHCIVSNRMQGILDALAQSTGLMPLVNGCVGRAGGRNSKLAVIQFAIESMNIHADAHLVLIGDRREDIEAGARLRLQTIAAGWGYARKGELAQGGPVIVARTVNDLWSLLGLSCP